MKTPSQDDALVAAVLKATTHSAKQRQELPCARAFVLAEEHGVTIGRISKICDANKIRIVQCQLECF